MDRGLQIWQHETLIDELESCELFVDYLASNTSILIFFSILFTCFLFIYYKNYNKKILLL